MWTIISRSSKVKFNFEGISQNNDYTIDYNTYRPYHYHNNQPTHPYPLRLKTNICSLLVSLSPLQPSQKYQLLNINLINIKWLAILFFLSLFLRGNQAFIFLAKYLLKQIKISSWNLKQTSPGSGQISIKFSPQ